MKIKSVAVLGAGAVGSYVIWGLSQKPEVRLGVIAEGERADRLRKNGCANNGRIYHPEVWSPEEAHNVDLLVVALKYGSLEGTLKSIQKTTGGHTVVMSLMNGVDSEEIIGRTVGTEHVLPALIKVASHKEDDGYHFDPPTTLEIIFGEPSAPFDSERVRAVEALFTDTGIHFRSTEYIQEEIWCKIRLNVYNNLPQAILGTSVGCYRDSVHMKAISDGLKRELEMVAKAKGIDMSKTGSSSERGSVVPPTARYSTLQDLDAGRHTEIDMFSGALVRMGKELGIPMPYNEYTYHMIKALEEKNDGKFNYTGNQKPIIEITVNENAVIHFELWPEIAPIACGSVMQLAEKKIFDRRAIERLEPGFVLQPLFFDGVDPQIDIMVEPEFKTNPENAKIVFERGIVAMAGDPENSSGSQYYITLAASERLNGNFTVIGKVIDGWDEIERLEHVEVEEAIEPQSGFVYHRPVKTEMITKVRRIK